MRFHDGGSGGFDQRRLSFHSKLRSVFEATIQELILEVTLGSRFKFTDVFWSVRDSRILERGEGLIRVVIRTAGVLVLPRVRRTINLI
jgi:hypothetical protein